MPQANADCVIIKHCASHFLPTSCCSQRTHALPWQACERDKVNLDSTTDRKWTLPWWTKFTLQPFWQEKDRTEALKAFRDVFKRQAPLHGLSFFFFFFKFKQRQDRSPLEDCPSIELCLSARMERMEMAHWGSIRPSGRELLSPLQAESPWMHHSVHCMKMSSPTDASEQRYAKPPHVPLHEDVLLSECQPRQSSSPTDNATKCHQTASSTNRSVGIDQKISFS